GMGVRAPRWPAPARQAVAPKLAGDRARMPAKYRGNLSLRSAGCMQPADRLTLCCPELLIMDPHRNTTLAGVLHLLRELRASRRWRQSRMRLLDSRFRGNDSKNWQEIDRKDTGADAVRA